MKAFTDYRRLVWVGGLVIIIAGFLAAALLLPSTSDPTKGLGPAVSVPKMKNIPPENQNVRLEVDDKKQ